MTPYEAIEAFEKQLKRNTSLKTVIMPSPLEDPGPIVEISTRKVAVSTVTYAGKKDPEISVRLTVRLKATVESLTGLKNAVVACSTLGVYLATVERLEATRIVDEEEEVYQVAGSRITETVNEEDAILEDPETGKTAWVTDNHFVTVAIPQE